jgi:hypothetical protein
MANHHGSEGLVKIGANTVAEVTGFSFTITADYSEDTTLSDTAKTYNSIGIIGWTGTVTAFWDETDTNGQLALVTSSNITLNLYPEGATTGDTYYYGTVLVTEITRNVQRGAITEITFNFLGNGAPNTGTA